MIDEKKAINVFKKVLETAIIGHSSLLDYCYNDKHWQICHNGFQLYIIPHTISDEAFNTLPQEEVPPTDMSIFSRTFTEAANGTLVSDKMIEPSELTEAVKVAERSGVYNYMIPVTSGISVVCYKRSKKNINSIREDAYFILNGTVAISARQLIQAVDLFGGAYIRITKPNWPVYINNPNNNTHALITPMSIGFWDDLRRSETVNQ